MNRRDKVFKVGVILLVLVMLMTFRINSSQKSNKEFLVAVANHATNANASSANASSANASSANASGANASSANASSANASLTDNIIYLQLFALEKTTAKPGERVNVILNTSGACNTAASIVFKGANGTTFTAQVQSISSNPYIVVPNSAASTKYTVTDVLLVGRNSDNTTFTKQYRATGTDNYSFYTFINVTEKEGNSSTSKIKLTSISLNSTSSKVGEKVFIDVDASEKLDSLKLVFTSNDDKSFMVYANDIEDDKPYFVIPSSTEAGTYSLTGAVISSTKSTTAYSKDGKNDTERFSFNSKLEISDEEETTFNYNNEDLDSEVFAKLYNAPRGSEITINADSDSLISEELFNTIKGRNKKLVINYKGNQIIFNGSDVTDSKTIDVTMSVDDVANNEDINKLVSKGVVVSFPDNGNLPGKALVRVKANDVTEDLNDKVFVYIYNESTNNFCEIDKNAKKSDDYYEFTITHNSDYLITNEELDSKLVVKPSDDVVSFQKSNKVHLLLILIAILVIVVVLILVLYLKKKKKTTSVISEKIVKEEIDDEN